MTCPLCSTEIEERSTEGMSMSGMLFDQLENKKGKAWNCAVCKRIYCGKCFTAWHQGTEDGETQRSLKLQVCSEECFRRGTNAAPRLP